MINYTVSKLKNVTQWLVFDVIDVSSSNNCNLYNDNMAFITHE